MPLNLQPNLFEPGKRYFQTFTPGDDFYEALIETHSDLSDEQSALVNAKLILLLSNHVGDISVLRDAALPSYVRHRAPPASGARRDRVAHAHTKDEGYDDARLARLCSA